MIPRIPELRKKQTNFQVLRLFDGRGLHGQEMARHLRIDKKKL